MLNRYPARSFKSQGASLRPLMTVLTAIGAGFSYTRYLDTSVDIKHEHPSLGRLFKRRKDDYEKQGFFVVGIYHIWFSTNFTCALHIEKACSLVFACGPPLSFIVVQTITISLSSESKDEEESLSSISLSLFLGVSITKAAVTSA